MKGLERSADAIIRRVLVTWGFRFSTVLIFSGIACAQVSPRTFEAPTGLPQAAAIASDSAGHIYIAGSLGTSNLPPIPAGAIKSFTAPDSYLNGYVARVAPGGDVIFWIAVVPMNPQSLQLDSSGNLWVSGAGIRSNVPGVITPCLSSTNTTADSSGTSELAPAVLKLSPDGATMSNLTCVGKGWANYEDIAPLSVHLGFDGAGNVYLAGTTFGYAGFQPTANALLSGPPEPGNYVYTPSPYLISVSHDFSQILYATWLPGNAVNSLLVDSAGDVTIGGQTGEASPLPGTAASAQSASGGSYLLRTQDGGQTFANAAAQLPGQFNIAVARLNPLSLVGWQLYANSLYRSGDGGATWTAVPLPPAPSGSGANTVVSVNQAILDDSGQTIYVTAAYPDAIGTLGMARYQNGQWTRLHPPGQAFGYYPSIGAGPNSTVYSFLGGVSVSTDSGNTWTLAVPPAPLTNFAPLPADGGSLYRVNGTNLEISKDAGKTITAAPLPAGAVSSSLQPHPNQSGVFFTYVSGGVARTTDFGQTWVTYKNICFSAPDPASANSVLCFNQNDTRIDLATGASTPSFVELGVPGQFSIIAAATNPAQFYVQRGARTDGFLCRLAAISYQLNFCSYLGGLGDDSISLLAPASDGGLWIAGTTTSRNFPVTSGALQTTIRYWQDNPQQADQSPTYSEYTDVTLCHLSSDNRTYSACTLFGGSLDETPVMLMEDSSGSPVLIGQSDSWDIPVTAGGKPSPFPRPSDPGPFLPFGGFILRASPDLKTAQLASVFDAFPLTAAARPKNGVYVYTGGGNYNVATSPTLGLLDTVGAVTSYINVSGITSAVLPQPLTVTPGGIAEIAGGGFATAGRTGQPAARAVSRPVRPLPPRLDSVSVELDGAATPLVRVSSTNIQWQLPWATPSGVHTVQVTGGQAATGETPVWVVPSYPVLFFDLATNDATAFNADGSANSRLHPAPPGTVLRVLFSGVGNVTPPPAPGRPAPTGSTAVATVTASVGPYQAPVIRAGASPDLIGISEAQIQIPSAVAGEYSLRVTAGGVTSNRVEIWIGATL